LWFDAQTGGNLIGSGQRLIIGNIQSDTTVYVEAFQVFGVDTCVSQRIPVALSLTLLPIQVDARDTLVCEGIRLVLPWGITVVVESDSSFMHTWYYEESGCDSAQMTINAIVQNALLHIELDSVYKLHLGDSIWLSPQITFSPDSVVWLPPAGLSCDTCLHTWAKPNQTTAYDLFVWSQQGCLVTAYVSIELSKDIRIYIPNVFTPNQDGVNDRFTVFARHEVVSVSKLTLYSRWGEIVWEAGNFLPDGSVGWDGTFRGERMSPGVFAWVCEVELLDGSREVLSGDVTLVR
jgi:gliding motility-associated-like protein